MMQGDKEFEYLLQTVKNIASDHRRLPASEKLKRSNAPIKRMSIVDQIRYSAWFLEKKAGGCPPCILMTSEFYAEVFAEIGAFNMVAGKQVVIDESMIFRYAFANIDMDSLE